MEPMAGLLSDRMMQWLRAATIGVLLAAVVYYIAFSARWPVLRDASVMHYVNLLIDHGLRPYREISDNNMPGAYLADRFGVLLFGGGDFAWRLYDWFLLATITASMVLIAKPYDWVAGLYGGLMFALLHGSEGPDFPVEREEVVTALLLAAFALLCFAVRRRTPSFLVFCGFLTGMAGSIKPTLAICGPLLLLALGVRLRTEGKRVWLYLLYGTAGIAAAGLLVLAYLRRYDAVQPLLFLLTKVLPGYVSLNHKSLGDLLRTMMPLNLMPLAAAALVLAIAMRRWDWERSLLVLGMLLGAASYLAQRKGSIYHRYPFVAFLLLLIGMELMLALRQRGWPRLLGALALLLTLCVSVPHYLKELRASPPNSTMAMALAMAGDLRRLHGADLQRNVECLDLTYGCFSALYREGIVENNGFTGDLALFSPHRSAAETFYRDSFWRMTQDHPPAVFVVTNEWFPQELNFAKLDTWPQFRAYLQANYTLAVRRSFPLPDQASPADDATVGVPAYRIYIRNRSPLLGSIEH